MTPKFRCSIHTRFSNKAFIADGRRVEPQALIQLDWKGQTASEHFVFKDVIMQWAKESCLGAVQFSGSRATPQSNGVWCTLHFRFELLEDVANFKLTWC